MKLKGLGKDYEGGSHFDIRENVKVESRVRQLPVRQRTAEAGDLALARHMQGEDFFTLQ